jgi:hypothetical protein
MNKFRLKKGIKWSSDQTEALSVQAAQVYLTKSCSNLTAGAEAPAGVILDTIRRLNDRREFEASQGI